MSEANINAIKQICAVKEAIAVNSTSNRIEIDGVSIGDASDWGGDAGPYIAIHDGGEKLKEIFEAEEKSAVVINGGCLPEYSHRICRFFGHNGVKYIFDSYDGPADAVPLNAEKWRDGPYVW
jgi:hypothetical protein